MSTGIVASYEMSFKEALPDHSLKETMFSSQTMESPKR
jgi:hypothetical protein